MKAQWKIQDSLELYSVLRWGSPYFNVNNKGHLCVHANGHLETSIDLKELVDELCRRDIFPPLLIRFDDILKSRIQFLAEIFQQSIGEYGYQGKYHTVMPIKVNQQRHVVEELVRHGKRYGIGLEAGSKPELLVAMAMLQPSQLLICNGYKDSEYIEIAMDAQSLGIQTVLVLDRIAELDRILAIGTRKGIRPKIGIRARLSAKGKGKWEDSSGDRSKFGLSSREIMDVVDTLQKNNLLDCIQLVHFHIGSQITSIRSVKSAVQEAARLYGNLREMGCSELRYIDIGGGLAVDYDGSQTDFHSSMNYSTKEYANDVVATIQSICDSLSVPHPDLISESGRALVAHHAVLIFNVLGSAEKQQISRQNWMEKMDTQHALVQSMWDVHQAVSKKNLQESYNNVSASRDEGILLFNHGALDLQSKALIEDLYYMTCFKIQNLLASESYIPEELTSLNRRLSDIYYCNFSVFQSMPDAWAVRQLFPIMPIHRLDEEPSREAILADLTCDSDGKVDQFIDLRDVKSTIRLHALNGKPYFLGAFLVGAYQETLGDLHNLFGDTHAVHVKIDPNGSYRLEHLVQGDTVADVLSYVEYDKNELVRQVRLAAESNTRLGALSFEQLAQLMKRYEEGLSGYTYLEDLD